MCRRMAWTCTASAGGGHRGCGWPRVPPGSERTPVARNVVRNVLQVSWDAGGAGARSEARPMNIPEGARPYRLRVVGLLEDARGRLRGIAQSRCPER